MNNKLDSNNDDYAFLKLRNFTKNLIELRKTRNQLSMRTYDKLEHRFICNFVFREQPKATVNSQKTELINDTR